MLDIDAQKVTEAIEQYITDLLDENKKDCVIMGLSGGIDSAVLVTLAERAVGAQRVKAYYLKDRDSEQDSERKAREMADWLDISLQVQDISSAMDKKGIYTPFIMRLSTLARVFNRLLIRTYFLIFRETPFLSSLKAGSKQLGEHSFKRMVHKVLTIHLENSFTARHIYRRELIEKAATEQNGLILGAGNRSEAMVGWFVKGGIDDLPIQPMQGLYKSQVWQLAEHLGLPANIRQQLPSPDMMKGITDELGIGMRYRRLDEILNYIEQGMAESEILAGGVLSNELKHVQDLQRFSDWKRDSPHVPPPVDGSAGSSFRVK